MTLYPGWIDLFGRCQRCGEHVPSTSGGHICRGYWWEPTIEPALWSGSTILPCARCGRLACCCTQGPA